MSGDLIDRRETGVHKMTVTDANGDSETTYQFNVKRVRAWAAMILAVGGVITMIGGGIAAGLRFGVRTEAENIIQTECAPGGMIDSHIQQTAYEMGEEIQGVIQDDLDYMDGRLDNVEKMGIELGKGQENITAQQTRNQDELKMLLRRAIETPP
jgi:hypothetical protein